MKVTIVMPAYNAAKTLERTFLDIPEQYRRSVLLVDDASRDATAGIARSLGIQTIVHEKNLGYGGNQKTCYDTALVQGADIVIMLHPDYQYDPRVIPDMVAIIARDEADVVMGSRFYKRNPRKQGMPLYKYIANRVLTTLQNAVFRRRLSEYHSGYRAYARDVLESIGYKNFSNNFAFDAEMLAAAIAKRYRVVEVSIPTRYFKEASQIALLPSVRYGFAVLGTLVKFLTRKF